MKNFKIAMIFVAAVAFFCSCGGTVEPPTMAFVDSIGQNEMTFDLTNPTADVVAVCQIEDEKGISTLNVTRTMYNADNEVVGTVVPYTFEEPFEGKTEYTLTISEILSKNEGESLVKVEADAVKVVYEAVATNKKGGEGKATYTVNIVAPSFTTSAFEWTREGTNNPDLSAFGLKWSRNNTKAYFAYIEPLNANAKLYELAAADYNATSIADITFPAAIDLYKKISVDATATYDNVIASVYEGKTYVFHITKATITSVTAGTKAVIEGEYKTFEATPAAK
ncbi:MAG: hypothetical protein J6T63_05790 [Bacteroidales bacterium]|nr:hypothetical protein [Bacteroidales bacterium]